MIRRCRCGEYLAARAEHVSGYGWRCSSCGGFQPRHDEAVSPAVDPLVAPIELLECSDGRMLMVYRRAKERGQRIFSRPERGPSFARVAVVCSKAVVA